MVISHNMLAMNASRQYNLITDAKAKTTEKLSSGYRINRAADDAAGLSISEKMRRQIRGLDRGIDNTADGVSLCQVADGALAEVNDMLHRITELSVQAANGTLSDSDRADIQAEITEINAEIDRIGDTTKFNELPIFQPVENIVSQMQGAVPAGKIPFSDFKLAGIDLGNKAFTASDNAKTLRLSAIVSDPDSPAYNQSFNLIFGNGSTSSSLIKITNANGSFSTQLVDAASITKKDYTYDSTTGAASRVFNIKNDVQDIDIDIKQTVTPNDGTDYKYYSINYEIINNSTTEAKVDFLFHADTAYNNNDTCEGYYTGGNMLTTTTMYSKTGKAYDGVANSKITTGVPSDFSILNKDQALSFSEKIAFAGNTPDILTVGPYSQIHSWEYNSTDSSSFGNIGSQSTNRMDIGFAAIWKDNTVAQGSSVTISLNYGIAPTESDPNLTDVPVVYDKALIADGPVKAPIWIQSGCDVGSGMYITTQEMNSKKLGLLKADVSTQDGALATMDMVEYARKYVTELRATFGAQQNRLEHTILNERNIVENTQAAESRIRDTDMADEMVKLSVANILSQAGESMIAQSNKIPENVLSLLQ